VALVKLKAGIDGRAEHVANIEVKRAPAEVS